MKYQGILVFLYIKHKRLAGSAASKRPNGIICHHCKVVRPHPGVLCTVLDSTSNSCDKGTVLSREAKQVRVVSF